MSIGNYLDNLRLRSDEQKKRVAFVWTTVLTVVIFFAWAISFSLAVVNDNSNSGKVAPVAETAAVSVSGQSLGGTFSWLAGTVNDGVNSVANGFWVIGDMLHK